MVHYFVKMQFLAVGAPLQHREEQKRTVSAGTDRKVTVSIPTGQNVTTALWEFVKKPDVAGKAFSSWCVDVINYASKRVEGN